MPELEKLILLTNISIFTVSLRVLRGEGPFFRGAKFVQCARSATVCFRAVKMCTTLAVTAEPTALAGRYFLQTLREQEGSDVGRINRIRHVSLKAVAI